MERGGKIHKKDKPNIQLEKQNHNEQKYNEQQEEKKKNIEHKEQHQINPEQQCIDTEKKFTKCNEDENLHEPDIVTGKLMHD